jgi:hypothetical protein
VKIYLHSPMRLHGVVLSLKTKAQRQLYFYLYLTVQFKKLHTAHGSSFFSVVLCWIFATSEMFQIKFICLNCTKCHVISSAVPSISPLVHCLPLAVSNQALCYSALNYTDEGKGVKVWLHAFLTSALDGDKRSVSNPGCFTPGKSPRYPLYRRLGGPQSRSGRSGEVWKSLPCRKWNWKTKH